MGARLPSLSLPFYPPAIGVGSLRWGTGGKCTPKFGERIFWGNYHVKFGNFVNFSAKCHVKFKHFVNFLYIYFLAKIFCPPKLTELLCICFCHMFSPLFPPPAFLRLSLSLPCSHPTVPLGPFCPHLYLFYDWSLSCM